MNPDQYRVVHRMHVADAEPLLHQGVVDVCVFDADLAFAEGFWGLGKIRQKLPQCPILAYTEPKTWEWEEEAYLQGVTFVLTKPVRARLLNGLLDRLLAAPASPPPPPPQTVFAQAWPADPAAHAAESLHEASRALKVLRDFSPILTHSLHAEAMLKQFLLLLREIIGVNRAAIFLRKPLRPFGHAATMEESRRLHSACALGIPFGLLEHFQLTLESGIGGFLHQQGRILRRHGFQGADPEIEKEFELLGAQVAVPMLDRETLVGVAVFDGRLTGEPLANPELELIFHLLEELGLAVKNIWLHDQLAGNHEMLADILRQLSSACVVVDRDLNIIHANKAAHHLLTRPGRRGSELEFSDLPQLLGSRIYQVLKTGSGLAPFTFFPPDHPESVHLVSIVPFQRHHAPLPSSVLLIAEDRTQAEQLQRLEIETANLRLVRSMADRLAHEIGNTLVPLATHQQLLKEQYKDPAFRESLETALADGMRRITRLVNQMRFLSREVPDAMEAIPLTQLVSEAFDEAQEQQPARPGRLECDIGSPLIFLNGDRAALRHALAEVMLNAIQANPQDPKVEVCATTEPRGGSAARVEIEVRDNGEGFTAEAAENVGKPFYTTRSVGLGLGLAVSRKIIETHRGSLTVVSPQPGHHGVVRIALPSDATRLSTS
ncbi:MAG: PAS domain-containing protein [Verrucomicrobia bacterium]|nr:PAS domain-containing protein [Verrucomicrobiota bacterium]